jgi:glycosyltransferase involved in cell wall biosynthesis
MEKQSYELIKGMGRYATVHTIVPAPGESRLRFFRSLRRRIMAMCAQHPGIAWIHFNDALIAAICADHRGYEGLRRAVTVHGLDAVFPNRWYQRYILPKFNCFDRIIAVSQATADACVARGLDPAKVSVVLNGVDHDIANLPGSANWAAKYGIDPDRPIMVAMGRAVRRKGFSWFIREVMPRMQRDAQLLIIGPFSVTPTLTERLLRWLPGRLRRQISLALGFPDDEAVLRQLLPQHPHVRHLGRLPFADVVAIFRAAHAFVMPNIAVEGDMEGFGLVCLEASLGRAPVFAANIDGIPSAIRHGHNGLLLPPADAATWAWTLDEAIDRPADFQRDATLGQAYTLQHFSWDKMVRAYLALFEAVV